MAGGRRIITVAERRARLANRHHLAPAARSDNPVEIANDLVGLHGTASTSVHLAALARMRAGSIADVERELYDNRTLVRLLGMRRTVFVVPVDLAAIVQAACTKGIAEAARRRYAGLIARAGVATDAGAWLREVEQATLCALLDRGEATGAELSRAEPLLRTSILIGEGKAYEGRQNITTWVLFLLSTDGKIIRGRPRGSWLSSQYRWYPVDRWLRGGLPGKPVNQARVELARRWLASYGPGTVADLRWWTGWTAGATRQALAALRPIEVDLEDGGTGLVLPGDEAPGDEAPGDEAPDDEAPDEESPGSKPGDAGRIGHAQPWAVLLPALDPTVMGWAQRDWYLGAHRSALFDRSGNAGPTVWCDGRVVGGWAQRRDGSIAYRLLEDVGVEAAAAVEAEAARAATWFGGVVAAPRFWTPLERDLSI